MSTFPSLESQTEILPLELKALMDAGTEVIVLDIREPLEVAICRLPDSLHIPMRHLPDRLAELEKFRESDIVVYCHAGIRSAACVAYMRDRGFKALNLRGGIDAWSHDVDKTVPRY
ncbi:MAG TPA: rhodanese-like domain-containing protein [Chroococcales cyanobacterium]